MSNIYLNYIQIAPIIFDENIIQNIFLLILAWPKKTGIIRCSIYTTEEYIFMKNIKLGVESLVGKVNLHNR
jgi:hypothetical protein